MTKIRTTDSPAAKRGAETIHRATVPESGPDSDAQPAGGRRLDAWLARAIPDLSRTRIKALIESGRVSLCQAPGREGAAKTAVRAGTITDPSRRVKPGECFEIAVPPAIPAIPEPEEIPLDVVYEDDDLIVIDKPAGIAVHPAPGNRTHTIVNALLAHCGKSLSGIGGVTRPGIVHRLDKDTSGLMVAAKNDQAHAALSEQFAKRDIARAYYAVVWGTPSPAKGEIEGNIGRSPKNRKKMAVVKRGGKPALTRYKVIRRVGSLASLVECRLATGRTHQIRVHMASIGHPVVGDATYGRIPSVDLKGVHTRIRDVTRGLGRQALHAYLIGFRHPKGGKTLEFESKLPKDIKGLISSLEMI